MALPEGVITAEQSANSSQLYLKVGEAVCRCVVVRAVESGALLCIPKDGLPVEVFDDAETGNFEGLVGPFMEVEVDAVVASRAQPRTLSVVILDVELNGFDGLSLTCPEGFTEKECKNFGKFKSKLEWPSPDAMLGASQGTGSKWWSAAPGAVFLSRRRTTPCSKWRRRRLYSGAATSVAFSGRSHPENGYWHEGPICHCQVSTRSFGISTFCSSASPTTSNSWPIRPVASTVSSARRGTHRGEGGSTQGTCREGAGKTWRSGRRRNSKNVWHPWWWHERGRRGGKSRRRSSGPNCGGEHSGEAVGVSICSPAAACDGKSSTERSLSILGSATQEDPDMPKSSGVKGIAAPQLLSDSFRRHPQRVVSIIRERLALARRKGSAKELEARDMWYHFQETVPLGSHKTLTYLAFISSAMFEAIERNDQPRLHMLAMLQAVFIEQAAYDGGALRLAHLLTCQEEPPFAMTELHKNVRSELAHAQLADPRWIATQLAFLKDLEGITDKSSKYVKPNSKPSDAGGQDDPPNPRPKYGPKKNRKTQEGAEVDT
eukprot:symbB.v1.2.029516.t1/scaffold3239.1/size60467/7